MFLSLSSCVTRPELAFVFCFVFSSLPCCVWRGNRERVASAEGHMTFIVFVFK